MADDDRQKNTPQEPLEGDTDRTEADPYEVTPEDEIALDNLDEENDDDEEPE